MSVWIICFFKQWGASFKISQSTAAWTLTHLIFFILHVSACADQSYDYVLEPSPVALPLSEPQQTRVLQVSCGRAHSLVLTDREGGKRCTSHKQPGACCCCCVEGSLDWTPCYVLFPATCHAVHPVTSSCTTHWKWMILRRRLHLIWKPIKFLWYIRKIGILQFKAALMHVRAI